MNFITIDELNICLNQAQTKPKMPNLYPPFSQLWFSTEGVAQLPAIYKGKMLSTPLCSSRWETP